MRLDQDFDVARVPSLRVERKAIVAPNQDPDARLIPLVAKVTPEIEAVAGGAGSEFSRGGMKTKIDAAKIATEFRQKFRKPVVPGDRIEYHMTKMTRRRNMWWYKGVAKVDGAVVCEAEVSAMLETDPVKGG